jgi:signal transduction histidine kinase
MSLRLSRFTSLRTRFMGLAVLLTLTFTAVWGGWVWQRERNQLHLQLEREGELLVSTMSIPIINALLYQELGIIEEGGLLDNFIADLMANQQLQPLYALVVDSEARVLAHNELIEYGKRLVDPLTRAALQREYFAAEPSRYRGEDVLDLQMPLRIAGKRWGALRVGVSLRPLQQQLAGLEVQIILFGFAFALGSLILFSLIGAGLSRPLILLTREVEKVPDADPDFRRLQTRVDEIGQLQGSFSHLLERLRQSEQARDASLRQLLLQERLVAAGQLAAGVAHEVNNPLAGIEGAVHALEKRIEREGGEYLELIRNETERISRLVNQLFDLREVERLDCQPIDSRELFRQLDSLCKLVLKVRVNSWRVKDLCQPQVLCVDAAKLKQVLLNLLLNAADAAGRDGEVEITVYDHEGDYCILVGDTGPGVPAAEREKIFDLFYTTKAPGKGTGIGLAMSRGIAEKHGGSLQLLQQEGRGAQLLLRLPLDAQGCGDGQQNPAG